MHCKVAFVRLSSGFSDAVCFFSPLSTIFVGFPLHYVLDLARLVGIFSIPWFVSLELLSVPLCVGQWICVLFTDGGYSGSTLGGKGTQGGQISWLWQKCTSKGKKKIIVILYFRNEVTMYIFHQCLTYLKIAALKLPSPKWVQGRSRMNVVISVFKKSHNPFKVKKKKKPLDLVFCFN